jgi:hypothetical protein
MGLKAVVASLTPTALAPHVMSETQRRRLLLRFGMRQCSTPILCCPLARAVRCCIRQHSGSPEAEREAAQQQKQDQQILTSSGQSVLLHVHLVRGSASMQDSSAAGNGTSGQRSISRTAVLVSALSVTPSCGKSHCS